MTHKNHVPVFDFLITLFEKQISWRFSRIGKNWDLRRELVINSEILGEMTFTCGERHSARKAHEQCQLHPKLLLGGVIYDFKASFTLSAY